MPRLEVAPAVGPPVSALDFLCYRLSCCTGVSSARKKDLDLARALKRAAGSSSAKPQRPTHSTSVERAEITWRPCGDLFEAIPQQVIDVLAEQHPSNKPRCRHAPIHYGRRNGHGDDALTAGLLRTPVPGHKKLPRHDRQLLVDVCADCETRVLQRNSWRRFRENRVQKRGELGITTRMLLALPN